MFSVTTTNGETKYFERAIFAIDYVSIHGGTLNF